MFAPETLSETNRLEVKGGATRRRDSVERRRARLRQVALENLEPRTLLAVLPPVTQVGLPTILSNSATTSAENESEPSIAINPSDPNNIAVVWVRYNAGRTGANKANVEGKVTFDGGVNWFSLGNLGTVSNDPATSNPVQNFAQVTDASVAFDRNNNLYVLLNQHAAGYGSGNLTLVKYSNGGNVLLNRSSVYQWNRSATNATRDKAIYDPVIAVDDTILYSDGLTTQTAPYAGNVYIAYMGDTPPPTTPPSNYQRTTIELLTSTDGGTSFGAPLVVNEFGNFSDDERNAAPKLVVSQGSSRTPLVSPGQVTVIWDDYGSGVNGNPPYSIIKARAITGGGAVLGAQTEITQTLVRGAQDDGPYPNGAGVTPQGIGPGPRSPPTTPWDRTARIRAGFTSATSIAPTPRTTRPTTPTSSSSTPTTVA